MRGGDGDCFDLGLISGHVLERQRVLPVHRRGLLRPGCCRGGGIRVGLYFWLLLCSLSTAYLLPLRCVGCRKYTTASRTGVSKTFTSGVHYYGCEPMDTRGRRAVLRGYTCFTPCLRVNHGRYGVCVYTIGEAFEHAPGGKTRTKKVSRTSVASHPLRAAGRTLFALFP